jgi:hypothetical protein
MPGPRASVRFRLDQAFQCPLIDVNHPRELTAWNKVAGLLEHRPIAKSTQYLFGIGAGNLLLKLRATQTRVWSSHCEPCPIVGNPDLHLAIPKRAKNPVP